MSRFCPLASGSKGNAIYLEVGSTRILIDAGLSGKGIQERLETLDVDLSQIDAILVSHEHTDHIRGLKKLAIRLGIPVLANAETAKAIYSILGECPKFKIFTTGETFVFKELEIHPFAINHDAVEPVAFTVRAGSHKLGFCTDLGFATTLVQAHLQECDYLYLEANHQPSMVHASPRPMVYKQRVLSRSGHLSNEACGQLLKAVYHSKLKGVHLAHLSEECNHPQVALDTVRRFIANPDLPIDIAPQHTPGPQVHF